jgi:hypothetical protein
MNISYYAYQSSQISASTIIDVDQKFHQKIHEDRVVLYRT